MRELFEPPTLRNRDLENLATGVELTLASVLQGIPLALLVPKIVDLIVAGDIGRLLYTPACLLIVFMVWISFVLYALSFVTWPFDPRHNLIYFFIVCNEAVLLAVIDRPTFWFGALISLGAILALNSWYNQRTITRQLPLFQGPARRALHSHIAAEQVTSLRFAWIYMGVGVIGMLILLMLERSGVSQQIIWGVAALGAMIAPLFHVVTLIRLVSIRSRLIEQAQNDPLS